jgi:hypothetical protein
MHERFDALATRLAESYATVPMEQGLAEIDRLTARVRAGTGVKSSRRNKG